MVSLPEFFPSILYSLRREGMMLSVLETVPRFRGQTLLPRLYTGNRGRASLPFYIL
jgi:hypothetical protein